MSRKLRRAPTASQYDDRLTRPIYATLHNDTITAALWAVVRSGESVYFP